MNGEFPGETLGHAGSSARGAAGKGYSRKAKVSSVKDTPSLFRLRQRFPTFQTIELDFHQGTALRVEPFRLEVK